MQRCLEGSDFRLSELKTRPEGLSLYLCLPQRYMSTHYRWLRMMIGLTVTEMEKVRGQPATGYPVLMVLDEFAGLKRMEVIESAVAQIASYGVKLFFVLQSLEQIKAVYKDNWETFLANSGLKVFFGLEDHFSRDYVAKLIGETEVIREVRSESDSTSESESHGRSSSTGTSETEGTNRSVSTGKSWGSNTSKGRSWNFNWTPGGFLGLGRDWQGGSKGQSESQGHSVTQSKGQSHGVSHGTSRSRTDGTSETFGTSKSRTEGSSETIQKRALVTPDEIGQLFARVDDPAHQAYPGLALVVISGARPVALRRVNYYEDYQFIDLFEPHPDYPFIAPKTLTVGTGEMGVSLEEFGLRLGAWSIKPLQIAAGGAEAAAVLIAGGAADGTKVASIRIPRVGLIDAVPGSAEEVPAGPLFSLRYYEDGAALVDPFAQLREACNFYTESLAREQRQLAAKKQSTRRAVRVLAVLAGVLVLAWRIAVIQKQDRAEEAEKAAAAQRSADEAAKKAADAAGLMTRLAIQPTPPEPAPAPTTAEPTPATVPAGSAQPAPADSRGAG